MPSCDGKSSSSTISDKICEFKKKKPTVVGSSKKNDG